MSFQTAKFPFFEVLQWYRIHGRKNLPWRQIYDLPMKERLYKVWVAEAMLQQTQVDRVIEYYNRFLKKYPTIESLAKTSYEELFPYWQGLGYYSRARNMIRFAQEVVDQYKWIIPDSYENLRKLPWIGDYTARAILAFWCDKSVLSIDANLRKIFARYYSGSRYASISEDVLKELEIQFQQTNISGRAINNALMDFGSTFTTFDTTKKFEYPLKECKWFITEGGLEQKKKIPNIKVDKCRRGTNSPFVCPKQTEGARGCKKTSTKHQKLCVFLHKNHREYYSSTSKKFEPFIVSPKHVDDRHAIQSYFLEKYHLQISVRPSFGNAKYRWLPVKLFYAQIQTGKHTFYTFEKEEKNAWLNALEKSKNS